MFMNELIHKVPKELAQMQLLMPVESLLRCRFAEKLSERYFRMVEGKLKRGTSQLDNQDTSASEDLLSMEE